MIIVLQPTLLPHCPDSGAWLSAGVAPKMFEMSNNEFVSAVCRRNAVEDPTIPKYTALISIENPQVFYS